jgi:hypothetical protein
LIYFVLEINEFTIEEAKEEIEIEEEEENYDFE